eukprot:2958167-Pyramimonas_sp.AAC.1
MMRWVSARSPPNKNETNALISVDFPAPVGPANMRTSARASCSGPRVISGLKSDATSAMMAA